MSGGDDQISFQALIERIAPEVPRFVVYPGKAWDETGTFIVDVSLNGIPIGLRNLIPWKERGWHFGLSQPICRKVGVETGDHVRVEMRRLGDTRPGELEKLLKSDPKAQKAWNAWSAGERRDFVLFVCGCQETGDTHPSSETAPRSLTRKPSRVDPHPRRRCPVYRL